MATGSFFRRPAVMLALALCSVGAVVTVMGRLAKGPELVQKRVQLSTGDGSEAYPALSPDGKRLAYSGRDSGEDSAFHIFVRELPSGKPLQLTKGEGSDVAPVWAPDGGTLAFVRVTDDQSRCITIPADGGTERKIADLGPIEDVEQTLPGVAWNADGKSLVVAVAGEKQARYLAVAALDSGGLRRITNPPKSSEGDAMPAVSPSGGSVAFLRRTQHGGDLYVCDQAGGDPRRLTFDDRGIRGIAWSHDGQDVVYSGTRVGGWRLWRVSAAGGSPRELTFAGKQAYDPAIGRNRLVYADSPTVAAIWRSTLGDEETLEERQLLHSSGHEKAPAWSPDGTKIADVSDQTGTDEIFVSDANGGNRVQITHLGEPPASNGKQSQQRGGRQRVGRVLWSPDGKKLIYQLWLDWTGEVFVVPAAPGGAPMRLLVDADNASFSHDGKRIYYQWQGKIWKADADGKKPEQLAQMDNAGQPVESVDGKYVYFRARRGFWRVPVTGGEPEEAFIPEHDMFWGWGSAAQATKRGIYYGEFERSSRTMVVSFYEFASKRSSVVLRMKRADLGNGLDFSVSPDEKYILYPRVDWSQTNLMLVENFK